MQEETQSESLGTSHPPAVPVFRGSKAEGLEFGLVLDAKGIAYDRIESGGV